MKTLSSAGDLASIRNRIALLSPADTRLWGSMSAHQAVCHLTDAFCCPLGERAGTRLRAWPIPIPIYKSLALYFPVSGPPAFQPHPR